MNCSAHPRRAATDYCERCQQPICDLCRNAFNIDEDGETYYLCADCYRRLFNAQRDEVFNAKAIIKREKIFIVIGIIIGTILGIVFGISGMITALDGIKEQREVISDDYLAMAMYVLGFTVIMAGCCGSFVTILKRIFYILQESIYEGKKFNEKEEDTGARFIYYFLLYAFVFAQIFFFILISPIMTIIRFFVRRRDQRRLEAILVEGDNYLTQIDQYIENTQATAMEEAVAAADNDEEIDLTNLLGASVNAELANNGEIIRGIARRK